MAILTIPDKRIQLTGFDEIKSYLSERNVWHDRWEASVQFSPDADQDTILAAYDHVLKPYMKQGGYQVADVISVNENSPNLDAIRAKFLQEHTHTEDEIRFFVDGKGYFWFNLAANGVKEKDGTPQDVFCVTCLPGDLISVPAGSAHWFDLGQTAFVKAIRIFIDPSGWVPEYTNSGVDAKYNEGQVL